jgi:hypothetical protein
LTETGDLRGRQGLAVSADVVICRPVDLLAELHAERKFILAYKKKNRVNINNSRLFKIKNVQEFLENKNLSLAGRKRSFGKNIQ